MAGDSYAKAIGNFVRFADAAASHRHNRPRRLALDAGLPPSSGYRAIAVLEAARFLARDLDGVYAPGPQLWRVGLNAWGLGGLHPGVEPVLARLRRDTRRSAFLGVVVGRQLWVGPYSTGRGYDFVVPEDPVLDVEVITKNEGVTRMRLRAPDEHEPKTGRLTAEMASVTSGNDGAGAVVGLLQRAGTSTAAGETGAAIRSAARRLRDAGDAAPG